jgi:hypothetical protein
MEAVVGERLTVHSFVLSILSTTASPVEQVGVVVLHSCESLYCPGSHSSQRAARSTRLQSYKDYYQTRVYECHLVTFTTLLQFPTLISANHVMDAYVLNTENSPL